MAASAVGRIGQRGAVAAAKIGSAAAISRIASRAAITTSKIVSVTEIARIGAQAQSSYARFSLSQVSGRLAAQGYAVGAPHVAGATYPDPSDVRLGVQYGPTGIEYTGTLVVSDALSSAALDAITSAIWSKNLPLDAAPPYTPGTRALSADEIAMLVHAVWSKSLP